MKTIRQLREERDWSQELLARRLGVGQGTISNWERGLKMPQPRTLRRLAELFGVSVEEIAIGQAAARCQDASQSRQDGSGHAHATEP